MIGIKTKTGGTEMISHGIGIAVGALIVAALVGKFLLGVSGPKGTVAREKIKMGAMAVDVRSRSEYAAGHYQGARNIPLQELQNRLSELGDKNGAVVVYCASGMRSSKAVGILTKAGFTDVMDAGTMRNLEE